MQKTLTMEPEAPRQPPRQTINSDFAQWQPASETQSSSERSGMQGSLVRGWKRRAIWVRTQETRAGPPVAKIAANG